MGFKRGRKLTTLGKPHNWLNSPNKCHQVCIICGREEIIHTIIQEWQQLHTLLKKEKQVMNI